MNARRGSVWEATTCTKHGNGIFQHKFPEWRRCALFCSSARACAMIFTIVLRPKNRICNRGQMHHPVYLHFLRKGFEPLQSHKNNVMSQNLLTRQLLARSLQEICAQISVVQNLREVGDFARITDIYSQFLSNFVPNIQMFSRKCTEMDARFVVVGKLESSLTLNNPKHAQNHCHF